jgi:hypothetical protein
MTEPDTPQTTPPPAPAPAPAPAAPAPDAPAGGLTAAEEAALGALLAKRDAAAGAAETVRMKVNAPEGTTITHGGVTVGTDFTDVPASMSAALTTAAGDAGMEIEQEVS